MSIRLIINADDFGLSKGVNKGILQAHHKGIVTSASIMVNMPGFEDAVEWAKQTPSLGVGFHFNLSYGRPVSPSYEVPSLVNDEGTFHKMKLCAPPVWKEEDVINELRQQWVRVKSAGFPITHLDSHHYIQRLPAVYTAYSELAHSENLPMRQTFQFPDGYNYDEYAAIVSTQETLPANHPPTTDTFIGDIYFKHDAAQRLEEHLRNLSPGITEINCHPGYVDQELCELSVWTSYREKELETLILPTVKALLQEKGIELVTYATCTKKCVT